MHGGGRCRGQAVDRCTVIRAVMAVLAVDVSSCLTSGNGVYNGSQGTCMAGCTCRVQTDSFRGGANIMAAGACAVSQELRMHGGGRCRSQAVEWGTVGCPVMASLAVNRCTGSAAGNGIHYRAFC